MSTRMESAAPETQANGDGLRQAQERVKERLRLNQERAEALREEMQIDARELRAAGVTWAEIGTIVGISAQAAYQRWSEDGNKKHRERQQARRAQSGSAGSPTKGTA